MNVPLSARRSKLLGNFNEVEGGFQLATSQLASNEEDLTAYFDQAIQQPNIEGLVVKLWDDTGATYELGKRSFKWLKVPTTSLMDQSRLSNI